MAKNTHAYEEQGGLYPLTLPLRVSKLNFPKGTQTFFYLHWHREFEFFLVTEGSACFTVENREYHVSKGECVFVNSNYLHTAMGIGEDCSCTAIVFFDTLLGDWESSIYRKYVKPVLSGRRQFHEVIRPDKKWQQQVLRCLEAVSVIPHEELRDHELSILSSIMSVWHHCFSNPMTSALPHLEQKPDNRLFPVTNYIHSSYMMDISAEQLAGLIPMSVGQFCRVFKQHLHMTPIEYLNRYRILQSCRLLVETDRPIAEVAGAAGFNNISYFNKTFRSLIGCTPSSYRTGRRTDFIL